MPVKTSGHLAEIINETPDLYPLTCFCYRKRPEILLPQNLAFHQVSTLLYSDTRQRGRVVSMSDSQSGGSRFESRSDH